MPSLLFWNVSKGWNSETIALLLNKTLCTDDGGGETSSTESELLPSGSVRVDTACMRKSNGNEANSKPLLSAKVTFASEQERDEIESYRGLVVPHTHGINMQTVTHNPKGLG